MNGYPSEMAGVGGSRSALSAMGRSLATNYADEMREELAKPEYRDRFFAAMRAGLQSCDRTCMRLYAESHKLVGSQMDLAAAMFAALGVAIPVALSAVDTVRRVENVSEAEIARSALEVLDAMCAEKGVTLEQLRASLSGAEVVGGGGADHGASEAASAPARAAAHPHNGNGGPHGL